jgi:hypothetical protein
MTEDRLHRFRRRFTYEADKGAEKLHWRVLDETDPRGDCEDYALTVAYIVAGGSWRRFWLDQFLGRAQVWAGKLPGGGGHAALWYRGRGWIDNTTGEWRAEPPLRRWFPVVPPLLAILMAPWPIKLALLVLSFSL